MSRGSLCVLCSLGFKSKRQTTNSAKWSLILILACLLVSFLHHFASCFSSFRWLLPKISCHLLNVFSPSFLCFSDTIDINLGNRSLFVFLLQRLLCQYYLLLLVFLGKSFLSERGKTCSSEYLYTIIIHWNECNWFSPSTSSSPSSSFPHQRLYLRLRLSRLPFLGLFTSRSLLIPDTTFLPSLCFLWRRAKRDTTRGGKWIPLQMRVKMSLPLFSSVFLSLSKRGREWEENSLQFIIRTKSHA